MNNDKLIKLYFYFNPTEKLKEQQIFNDDNFFYFSNTNSAEIIANNQENFHKFTFLRTDLTFYNNMILLMLV
jgi:hypothetical protein